MAFQKTVSFDAAAEAQDLRFYKVQTSDENGDPVTEIHCTALFEDSEGKVISVADKLSGCTTAEQRAALAGIRDTMAARAAAAANFSEVA